MGEVIDLFPKKFKIVRNRDSNRKTWYVDDFAETVPDGHPTVKYDLQGNAILAVGQVWVPIDSERLWVIHAVSRLHENAPFRSVVAGPYRNDWSETYQEWRFLRTFTVYELAVAQLQ